MELSDISSRTVTESPESTSKGKPAHEQCEQCSAPVDSAQRYCVVCGAHRGHVHDPAARYLSAAAARTRTSRPSAARAGGVSGIGVALVLVAIPLAIGLGVLVGRSSSSGDAKLIAALRAQKPEIITTSAGTSAGPSSSASATGTARRERRTGSATAGGKVLSSTSYGTAHQIAGSKPTQAQLATSAQAVRHVQQTEGSNYVNAQRGLPDQISIP